MKLSALDNIPGMEVGFCEPPNPSFCLMWQDVLLGLYDKDIEGFETKEYYAGLARELADVNTTPEFRRTIFDVPQKACEVLTLKADMGIRLKKAYDGNDRQTLTDIANTEIPELINRFEALHEAFRRQWHAEYKPFGFEVWDIRYGGAVARLKTAKMSINDYLEGQTPKIDQLVPQRLPFFGEITAKHALHWTKYNMIVTPGIISTN